MSIMFQFANLGARSAKQCDKDSRYFSLIDECIPLFYTSMPTFLQAYQVDKTCHGLTVETHEQLEGLRYCDHIDSGLTIEINDPNADFSSLRDINFIGGIF